jgi:CSLREA domain-containing protein
MKVARHVSMSIPLALVLLFTSQAAAATITPTPGFFADDFTNNANCSLREAISVANEDASTTEDSCVGTPAGPDVVQLEAGAYVLDIVGIDENGNATGDLDVNTTIGDSLTLAGAGAGSTTIAGDNAPPWTDRILHRGGADSNNLTVRDLTITGGNDTDLSGGGGGISSFTGATTIQRVRLFLNQSNDSGAGAAIGGTSASISESVIEGNISTGVAGGGVLAAAGGTTIDSTVVDDNRVENSNVQGGGGISGFFLTLTDSLVTDNKAVEPGNTGTPSGAGIQLAGGASVIRNTTIADNEALGGLIRSGGGIRAVIAGTTVTLINSTVSGNEALGTNGFGGGVVTANSAVISVAHSTIGPNPSGNTFGSSLNANSGSISVRGSAVAAAPGTAACAGTVTSADDNVFADVSCGAPTANDVVGLTPDLGFEALADNGGPDAGAPGLLAPVPTHLPAVGSPVVDHVPAADCNDHPTGSLVTDQRGQLRPADRDGDSVAECDAGSVELEAPPVVNPPPPQQQTQPPAQTEDPACALLRKKLKKAKSKAKKTKIRKQLRKRGC